MAMQIGRRDFMKAAGIGAAGALVLPGLVLGAAGSVRKGVRPVP